MAKGYRNQMTPGLKKCIDYMRSAKSGSTKQKPKTGSKKLKY